jgi:hypothetical protein
MRYLVIDALLNGTGIRDEYEGGYIDPKSLGISNELIDRLSKWLIAYEEEHYNNYSNIKIIDNLDCEGKAIALRIKNEVGDVKITYYSDARLTKEPI